MDDVTIARAFHVLAVVLWIGGVAFVTTVLLPAVREAKASAERVVFWMHAMLALWLLFTLILFVAEPLVLDQWLLARAETRPEWTFSLIERLHWTLLVLSLISLIGAVLGSHGVLLMGLWAER